MNEILLMLPGPTTADPRVLQAMGKAVVNHRGDEFGEIYTETTQLMSKTFQTENDSYILTILTSLPVQELQQWKLLFQTLLTEEIKY